MSIKCYTGNIKSSSSISSGRYTYFDRSSTPKKIDSYKYDGEYIIAPSEGNLSFQYINGKFSHHQKTYRICSDIYKTKYLYYFLMKNKDFIEKLGNGTTVKRYNMDLYKKINIKNIDLNTQQQIIDIIEPKEKLFMKYNRLVNIESIDEFSKSWSVLIDIIEPFERKIYNLRKKINDLLNIGDSLININHEKAKLKNFCNINIGSTPSTSKKEYWDGKYDWLNSGALTNNLSINKGTKKITDLAINDKKLLIANHNSILFSIIEPSKNKISLVNGEYYYNQSICNIQPHNWEWTGFIFFSLRAQINEIKKMASGTAQQSVNKSDLSNFEILNPKYEKRLKLLNLISTLIKKYSLQIDILDNIINLLVEKYV